MNSFPLLMILLLAIFYQGTDANDCEIGKFEILSEQIEEFKKDSEKKLGQMNTLLTLLFSRQENYEKEIDELKNSHQNMKNRDLNEIKNIIETLISNNNNENNIKFQKIYEEKFEQTNTYLSQQENQIKSLETNLIQKMEKIQAQLDTQEIQISQQNNKNIVNNELLNKQIAELKKINPEKIFENKLEQMNSHFDRQFSMQDNKIKGLETNLIPIGFIYTQLPNTSAPQQLWPQFNWTEVTEEYSGYYYSKSFKYPELSSIASKLLKKINRFIIHTDYDAGADGFEVFLFTHCDDVFAFGRNRFARLGFGHQEVVKEPKIIPELCGKKVKDIKCGDKFCVALTQSGKIYTFGNSNQGKTGNGNNNIYHKPIEISVDNQTIVAIDCTNWSTYLLTQTQQLYRFGFSWWLKTAYTPTKVVFPSEMKIKNFSCGLDHVLALTVEEKVFSWGYNFPGTLGLGHNNNKDSPQIISMNENIEQVYSGEYHNLLLTITGKVYSMGFNNMGQLGIGNKNDQNIPQLILSDQKEICCYRDISMSLDINNKLYIWGNIYRTVVSPIISELPSFQEVIDHHAKRRSTIKPINLEIQSIDLFYTEIKIFKRIEYWLETVSSRNSCQN